MADNLEDTRDIVAELEDLLAKSVEHAKELPKWMRKLLGITDEVAILKAEIARLSGEEAEAADENTENTKKGIVYTMYRSLRAGIKFTILNITSLRTECHCQII